MSGDELYDDIDNLDDIEVEEDQIPVEEPDEDEEEERLTRKERLRRRGQERERELMELREKSSALERRVEELSARTGQPQQPQRDHLSDATKRVDELYKEQNRVAMRVSRTFNDENATQEEREQAERDMANINRTLMEAVVDKRMIEYSPKPKDPEEDYYERMYPDIMHNEQAKDHVRARMLMARAKSGKSDYKPTRQEVESMVDEVRREMKLGPYSRNEPTEQMRRSGAGLRPGSGGSGGSGKGGVKLAQHEVVMANAMYSHIPDQNKRLQMYVKEVKLAD